MDDIKPYKDASYIEKRARDAFGVSRCNNCFIKDNCGKTEFNICFKAYIKGFIRGVKHHRQIIKNKNKK